MMTITTSERDEVAAILRQPPNFYNCCQCVAVLTNNANLAQGLQGYGGGRAPGGLCGALHAALTLVPPDQRDAVRAEFAENAGAETCSDIKNTTKTPCPVCVALAAALVKKYTPKP